MKMTTALLTVALTLCFSLSAAGQDVAGFWQVESVSNAKPPKGLSLTLSFAAEDKATITYTVAGESQSWTYRYEVVDGQLKLTPANPFGEPKTVTYDIKFDEGKLLLLTPKPKATEEEEAEAESAPDADNAAEAGGDAAPKEEAEEEDTRVAVWVLVKA